MAVCDVLINLILAVCVLGFSWSLEELVAKAEEVGNVSSDDGNGKTIKWSAGFGVKGAEGNSLSSSIDLECRVRHRD
jgi:hypothetical protein